MVVLGVLSVALLGLASAPSLSSLSVLACLSGLSLATLTGSSALLMSASSDTLSRAGALLVLWVGVFALQAEPRVLKAFTGSFCLLAGTSLVSFSALGYLSFYLAFELSLLPMSLLLVGLGSQPERASGFLHLWLYTLAGSVPMLLAVLCCSGLLLASSGAPSSAMAGLGLGAFSVPALVGFLVKAPVFLGHLWLPQAHVEASVAGSVLLAGLLLKFSVLGLARVSPFILKSVSHSVAVYAVLAGALAGAVGLCQVDLKSAIAYSSVLHMSLPVAGLACLCSSALAPCLLMALGHGLVSSALFSVGTSLYSRSGSRSFLLSKALALSSSGFVLGWAVLAVLNVSVPPFMSFVSELSVVSLILSLGWASAISVALVMTSSLALSLQLFSALGHGGAPAVQPTGAGLKALQSVTSVMFWAFGSLWLSFV